MLQSIKNLLERNSLFLAIIFSLLVLVLSLINLEGAPKLKISNADKLEHMFAYAIISFFWVMSHGLGKISINFIYLLLLIIGYGVIIEVLQTTLTTNRTGDFADIIANTMGVILGTFFFKILSRLYLQV